jgi:hypothetical protein
MKTLMERTIESLETKRYEPLIGRDRQTTQIDWSSKKASYSMTFDEQEEPTYASIQEYGFTHEMDKRQFGLDQFKWVCKGSAIRFWTMKSWLGIDDLFKT